MITSTLKIWSLFTLSILTLLQLKVLKLKVSTFYIPTALKFVQVRGNKFCICERYDKLSHVLASFALSINNLSTSEPR